MIDCIAESESEGINDWPLLDRVDGFDDWAGLIWIGAVVDFDGSEVRAGVKTLTGVMEGLFAGDGETLGDNEMVGDTVVEIEGIDGFFVGEVLTALEVDGRRGGRRGDEDGKAIAVGLDDINPSFGGESSDGRENATPKPTADNAADNAADSAIATISTQFIAINNLIRLCFHH